MSLSSFLNWAQMMNSSFIEIKIVTLHWRASIILMVTMQYFKYFISTLLKPHYIIQKKILSWTIPSFQIFTYLSHLHLWYIRENSEQIVQFGEDRSSFYVTENTSNNLEKWYWKWRLNINKAESECKFSSKKKNQWFISFFFKNSNVSFSRLVRLYVCLSSFFSIL